MEELHFNCPAYLAQRFWILCNEAGETPGTVLREYMLKRIADEDPSFEYSLKAETGHDAWSVRQGVPKKNKFKMAPAS